MNCKKYFQPYYNTKEYLKVLTFTCIYCDSQRKNKNSLINHERCCPQNPNRVYKNGMTGKRGSNQYIYAEKMGLPKPIISDETKLKIGEKNTINNLNRDDSIHKKISVSMKKAHSEYRAGRLNPIKKYKKFNRPCLLYVIQALHNDLEIIKIGITEQQINKRFRGIFNNYKILHEIYLENGLFVARLEDYLLRYFTKNGKRIQISEKFAGYTECFEPCIFDDLQIQLNKFLFTNIEFNVIDTL